MITKPINYENFPISKYYSGTYAYQCEWDDGDVDDIVVTYVSGNKNMIVNTTPNIVDKTILFLVGNNISQSERSANVKADFYKDGEVIDSRIMRITQAPYTKDFDIDKDSLTFTSEGGERLINVVYYNEDARGNLEDYSDDDWATLSPRSDGNYTLRCDPNDEGFNRDTTVHLSFKDTDLYVTVVQGNAGETVVFSPIDGETFRIDHSGQNLVMEYSGYNIDNVTITADSGEISMVRSTQVSTDEKTVTFYIYENYTQSPRVVSYRIDFYNPNGEIGVSRIIYITQDAQKERFVRMIPDSIRFDADGNSYTVVEANITDADDINDVSWTSTDPTILNAYQWLIGSKKLVFATQPKNTSTAEREVILTGNISFNDGTVGTVSMTLTQDGQYQAHEAPLWEDTEVMVGSDSYWRVVIDDNEVYRGKTSQPSTVWINDIVESYINIDYDIFSKTITNHNGYVKVNIDVSDDTYEWRSYAQYNFYYNYSYNEDNIGKPSLNKRPTHVLDSRQYATISLQRYNENYDNEDYMYLTNTKDQRQISTVVRMNVGEQNTITIPCANVESIMVYKGKALIDYIATEDRCGRYCLYYLNTLGGWDSMVFDGKELRNVTPTSYMYDRRRNSSKPRDFQSTVYNITQKEKWTLTTGLMTADYQAKAMEDLFTSPIVYLQDFETNKIYAVNVTSKTYDEKNFRNSSKKPFSYTVEVTNSQTKTIRGI